MPQSTKLEQLLECLIHVIGRAAVPPTEVAKIVGAGQKQITAFNLCDGSNTQKEIAKKTRIDQGQLSRTFSRWVESGIAFWIGHGKSACLLHIYPINPKGPKSKG